MDTQREALRWVDAAIQGLPDVDWMPSEVFGTAEPRCPSVSPDVVYVRLFDDPPRLQVIRFFSPEPPQDSRWTYGEACRWIEAALPGSENPDLPDLATAVALQRLPASAFPLPGEQVTALGVAGPVTYPSLTRMAIAGHELPLWRVMEALGRLG